MAPRKAKPATGDGDGENEGEVTVHPVTAERWPDLVDLFTRKGPRGGKPITDGCWCQFWILRGREGDEAWGAASRTRMRKEVAAGTQPGLLAYLDGVPVGWCRIGPREQFERLESSVKLRRIDDKPVWSLVCFYVHPAAKRRGVGTTLLAAAADHAASHGARLVEAYPVDAGHMNLDAYTGYLPMFTAAGYRTMRRAGRRSIVRKRVAR